MKAQVENSVMFLKDPQLDYEMLCKFNQILDHITVCDNEKALRNLPNWLRDNKYFSIGFGSNHMWVCQKSLRTPHLDEVLVNPAIADFPYFFNNVLQKKAIVGNNDVRQI